MTGYSFVLDLFHMAFCHQRWLITPSFGRRLSAFLKGPGKGVWLLDLGLS
ncbi:hypothetical protein FOQG_19615 [Fusarium oxysporum f. sp. raphani 54005]|uniref:Uncharacterized protein n=1 Tax=Fusarium oxysporum f. sp. raphani 54005 TaxID=1089458 RepID=X0BYK0_FUSOX|nr:hypothetical protein FOQG_19615 [Fusarium oxysporum f. sp. raphani 54005]